MACQRYGVPYQVVGGVKFYQRKEIKDITGYLLLILKTHEDLSLKKILQSIFDRSAWLRSMDYFLYRDLNHNLSSEDAYVYFDDSEMRKFSSLELE